MSTSDVVHQFNIVYLSCAGLCIVGKCIANLFACEALFAGFNSRPCVLLGACYWRRRLKSQKLTRNRYPPLPAYLHTETLTCKSRNHCSGLNLLVFLAITVIKPTDRYNSESHIQQKPFYCISLLLGLILSLMLTNNWNIKQRCCNALGNVIRRRVSPDFNNT